MGPLRNESNNQQPITNNQQPTTTSAQGEAEIFLDRRRVKKLEELCFLKFWWTYGDSNVEILDVVVIVVH